MQRVTKKGGKSGQVGARSSNTNARKLPSLPTRSQVTACQTELVPMAAVVPPISENPYMPPTSACNRDLQVSHVSRPVFSAQRPESVPPTRKQKLVDRGEASKCHPNGPTLEVITKDCHNSTDPLQNDPPNSKFTAPAGLFRKHQNLVELLDQKHTSEQANRVDIPEGSKTLFRRFLRGYVGTTLLHQKQSTKHPTFEEFALSNLFGELDEGVRAEPPRDATQGDHYDYFSRVPVTDAGNPHDQNQRLQCMRMLNRRHRVVVQKSKDRPSGVMAPISGPDYAYDCIQPPSPQVDGVLSHHSTALNTLPSSGSFRGRCSAARAHQAIKAPTTQALKADMRTRKACESLRDLIFGIEYTEARRSEGTGAFYEQKCGTKEEVMLLHMKWTQMDTDGSGDVEYKEFIDFFSRSKADRYCGMRCVNYLVGKNKREGVDDDEEGGCTVEDMMRLLWLKATDQDVKRMMNWFQEAEFEQDRIPTPPLLPERKQRQILENFPSFAKEKKDKIPFSELLASGLFTEGALMVVGEHFDKEPTTEMTREEVLEILCPNGYLAHKDAKQAVDVEGRPLAWVANKPFTGWVVAGSQRKWAKLELPDVTYER